MDILHGVKNIYHLCTADRLKQPFRSSLWFNLITYMNTFVWMVCFYLGYQKIMWSFQKMESTYQRMYVITYDFCYLNINSKRAEGIILLSIGDWPKSLRPFSIRHFLLPFTSSI